MLTNLISYSGFNASQKELPNYLIDFISGNDILFITFEHASGASTHQNIKREPWGFKFLVQKRGYSLLGVKPKQNDWYRNKDLHQFFQSHEFKQFISRFKKVFLYGGSMGGYAALAFAEAVPGCTVIALNPQSTLDKKLIPWEKRFKSGQEQDWQNSFHDGAIGASFAEKAYVVYDPFHNEDKKHIDRLNSQNIIHLKVFLVGHQIPTWLLQMGILGTLIDKIVSNSLTELDFYKLARTRKSIIRYFLRMAESHPQNLAIRRSCANQALTINSMDRKALKLHCECLFEESKFIDVLVIAENILKLNGIELAFKSYIKIGKPDKAIGLLTQIILHEKPIPQELLQLTINLALSLNEFEIAEKLLAKAAKTTNNRKIIQLANIIKNAKNTDMR